MNGITAKNVCLVSHFNSRSTEINEHRNATSFSSTNELEFRANASTLFGLIKYQEVVAIDIGEWFSYLRKEGCQRLYLKHYSGQSTKRGNEDHRLAGFVGGGGLWVIEAKHPSKYTSWVINVQSNKEQKKKKNTKRIWDIKIVQSPKKITYSSTPIPEDKGEQIERLYLILEKISLFAEANDQAYWVEKFRASQEQLTSRSPSFSYDSNMSPKDGLDLESRRLICASSRAFVFGGMGSWNDLWIKDEECNKLYFKLSAALYAEINHSIEVALNN